jgi:unsaturated chondroitin disaccharide hydrolase
MHAYAASYAATNDPALLAIARKVADYWIGHVPADGVPYWDFDAPVTATTYRDSSASAIAASALVQLSQIDPDATRRPVYRAAAEKIINSLLSPSYFAEGTANSGVLLHGAAFVPRKNPLPDSALIYGDYYFLEALNRYANS